MDVNELSRLAIEFILSAIQRGADKDAIALMVYFSVVNMILTPDEGDQILAVMGEPESLRKNAYKQIAPNNPISCGIKDYKESPFLQAIALDLFKPFKESETRH